MGNLLLVINEEKPRAVELAGRVTEWLGQRNVRTVPASLGQVGICSSPLAGVQPELLDAVLVLGGDGTLLNAARAYAPTGLPIMGINVGQLGFLTAVEARDLEWGLEQLLAGNYRVQERMMLEARVEREKREAGCFYALNDVVITKGAFSRLIRLETKVGEHYIETYHADGLIISSSTGSTAYSLSAGGPIVSPELAVVVLTPICPHSLFARPLVISPAETVGVILHSERAEVMLTVDGQHGFRLSEGDRVTVTRAPFAARLVQLPGRSFYEVLREKLRGAGPGSGECLP